VIEWLFNNIVLYGGFVIPVWLIVLAIMGIAFVIGVYFGER